ncbi:MAG: hypothetical protein DMF41_04110 [Verrucomicrobia bacterium]|nr:MAG: hypothetical protein DME62_14470 [Verrucomicrobiota bacterium]PYL20991.1 MAG: hypothetical protein DMF41_04110 [Verrucomicrobiota bacterium]
MSPRAGDGCLCTRFHQRRSASLESRESVLGIRQSQRSGKVSRALARRFRRLTVCQLSTVRKDHITDWITANTSKGVKLQSYSIEELAIHVTGDVAINHYRIKANWANNEGAEVRIDALRITHTWIRTHGTWQILGGHVRARERKGSVA